jgi:hypothetical protein
VRAERKRREMMISADGVRERDKTMAEGECQRDIALSKGRQMMSVLRAKGQADAKVRLAPRSVCRGVADALAADDHGGRGGAGPVAGERRADGHRHRPHAGVLPLPLLVRRVF